MKKLILLMALAIGAIVANAQTTKVITGVVIDKYGNPLPNALVEATGGAESVMTDADGTFRIEVSNWLKKLTAKYAGCADKTLTIGNKSQLIFEMKKNKNRHWFVDAVGSINFGDETYGRVGLMAGYLGKWGGYAKIMESITESAPSITLGAIKQISNKTYLYLGLGFSNILYDNFHINHYDYTCASGAMCEAGTIFRYNKFNFSTGVAYSSDLSCATDFSIQASVGYCF